MVGYIQYVLVNTIRHLGGDAALDAVAARLGLAQLPEFRIDSDYDNAQCLAMIEATGAHFGLDRPALFRLYADQFIVASRRQFPFFYDMAESAEDFLRRQPRIHKTLASSIQDKGTRERVTQKFELLEGSVPMRVRYYSPNKLCGLYEALFYRLLDEYGQSGHLSHDRCQHRGDSYCEFSLYFSGESP